LRSWVEEAQADKTAFKLVNMYQHRPAEELYDLRKDSYELKNIADDPAQAERKASLRKRLEAWMRQQGDLGNETEMKARKRQGRGGGRTKTRAGPRTKRSS